MTSCNSKERFNELKETGKLPSPEGTALAIIQLTEQEDVPFVKVVRLVQSDPAIAGCLLKFANAAQFGNSRPVVSMIQAVTLLGLFRVRQLVLGIALINKYGKGRCKNFNYEKFWSQSLATAIAAQKASIYVEAAPAESFTGGLLADVGRLALATLFPQEYSEVLQAAAHLPEAELIRLERERFDIDHRGLTLFLLEEWRLPKVFLQAIAHQENPDQADPPLGPRAQGLAVVFRFAAALGGICVADKATRWYLLPNLYHLGARLGATTEETPGLVDGVVATWQEWGNTLRVATHALPSFSEMQAADPASLEKEAGPDASPDKDGHYRIKVLLVGSNGGPLQEIRQELAGGDYPVVVAAAVGEALKASEGSDPQLVICDLTSGYPDAIDLPKTLRLAHGNKPMYFIALLSDEQQHTISLALENCFDDYIKSPLESVVFQARLATARRVLRLHKSIQLEREYTLKNTSEWGDSNRRLLQESLTDPLTGLPNRRYGMDRLAQESAFAAASGSPLCCLMIDIDHFKRVNDKYGHEAGDQALHQIARVLLQTLRKNDVAFRYGGEEFVVLCPGTPPQAAIQLAERIRQSIADIHFEFKTAVYSSTVSIGVSVYDPGKQEKEALIKQADAALYRAKNAGRNRVVAG